MEVEEPETGHARTIDYNLRVKLKPQNSEL